METPISNNSYEKLINDYVLKQKRFKYLVKQIQMTINACEYKKYGYSLSEYVKRKWNISQLVLKIKFLKKLKKKN